MKTLLTTAITFLTVLTVLACGHGHSPASAVKSGRASDLNRPRPMPRLTKFFSANCAMCHGANGDEGFAPVLAGIAFADYEAAIRGGHPEKGVPAFARDEYSDKELKADFDAINAAIP